MQKQSKESFEKSSKIAKKGDHSGLQLLMLLPNIPCLIIILEIRERFIMHMINNLIIIKTTFMLKLSKIDEFF